MCGCNSRLPDDAWKSCDAAVNQAIRLRLSRARGDLAPLAAHLAQLSPLKILDRGYAIVEREAKVKERS